MAKASTIQTDFSGGEFSPQVRGRVDAQRYRTGLDVCENFIPTIQGSLTRRPGTKFISEVKDSSSAARIHEFEFATDDNFIIEFGDQTLRFYKTQGNIVETAKTITDITQADPAVVTITAHNYSDGDEVYITDVVGMTEVNGKFFKVANKTANTFELTDLSGADIDSTGFTAYSSGGDSQRVYAITTPYLEADLFDLRFVQSDNALYIFHVDYQPRLLSRNSDTDWDLDTVTFTNGPYLPTNITLTTFGLSATSGSVTLTASSISGVNGGIGFQSTDVGRHVRIRHSNTWGWGIITAVGSTTSATLEVEDNFAATTAVTTWALGSWSDTTGWPKCATFHEGRLFTGGAPATPQQIDASAPLNFTTFSPSAADLTVTDSNAISFLFNSAEINEVRWMKSVEKGLSVGTSGGEWLVRPDATGAVLTPANVTAKRSTRFGSADIEAIQIGSAVVFVQRARRKVRDLSYFDYSDGYQASDITILAEHITTSRLVEFSLQQEPQPIAWFVREDGQLAGLTYERTESGFQASWHRQIIGGFSDAADSESIVESVAVLPSETSSSSELWIVVKREINGVTKRYIEVVKELFDDSIDQKDAFFVDSGLTYDEPLTITGATKANPVVITSASHDLSNGDKVLISKVIGMTDLNTNSYLVANKTANTFELTDLDGDDIDGTAFSTYVSGGEIRKYVSTITGLDHLEGESVAILGDGAVLPDETVSNGQITLDTSATTVTIGFSYKSRAKLLRIEGGSADGTSIGKTRRIHRVAFMLHRSLGLKIGESFDDLTTLTFRTASDEMSRAPALFTGIRSETVDFNYDFDNYICIEQEDPLPLTILAIMPQFLTQDR